MNTSCLLKLQTERNLLSQLEIQTMPTLDPRLSALAEKITRAVRGSGLSNTEISARIGVSRSLIGKWMTGERIPQMQNLIDLADLLGLEMRELWDDGVSLPSTPEQRLMLELMAGLTPEAQQLLIANAQLLKGKPS